MSSAGKSKRQIIASMTYSASADAKAVYAYYDCEATPCDCRTHELWGIPCTVVAKLGRRRLRCLNCGKRWTRC